MKKRALLLSAVLSCAIYANTDVENLRQYLLSKNWSISGSFYRYDFNKDGKYSYNDWLYIALGSGQGYRLLGKEPTKNNIFGWQALASIPSDLAIHTPDGYFVFINYPNDVDRKFSWLYIANSSKKVYKLEGAEPDTYHFKYMDINGDGTPDALPGITANIQGQTILFSSYKFNQGKHNQKVGMGFEPPIFAYFGDKENNKIDVVDVNNMRLIDEIYTGHQKTYAAEVIKIHGQGHSNRKKMYVDNRGSDYIDVIDSASNTITKSIHLPFHPRSIDVEKITGLVAVSGVDKPMIAVIDGKTDRLLATAGRDVVTYPTTSGHNYVSSGTLACGHPHWLDENHVALIDRQAMKIITYKLVYNNNGTYSLKKVNEIDTPSPVHNLIPPEIHGMKGHRRHGHIYPIFYATAEGSDSAYPSVMKLYFSPNEGLKVLENLELKKDGLPKNVMGVHHLNFIKRSQKIYVGSDEGTLFVVDYASSPMKIIKTLQAGKGAGHTAQMEHGFLGDIAVVINHKDRFITLVDTDTDTKIADINVSQLSDEYIGQVQTQSHPKYHFSKDGRYFYLFLTEEGAFVKVDLQSKKVVDRLDIGGKIAMGSFIKEHNR